MLYRCLLALIAAISYRTNCFKLNWWQKWGTINIANSNQHVFLGHLKKLGIPVIRNSKVGYNLQDHLCPGGLTFLIDKPYSVRTEKIFKAQYMVDYLYHHKGPMSLPGGCEVLTFNELDDPLKEDGYPDIELLSIAGSIGSDPLLRRNFGITGKHTFE